ncbi:hypothetical protein F993_00106 [Acinetobacter proteolyticus]|uniref:Uncharacterized protein n=1 Tax=Acinetobacter proteolyticus TaxID=1776741 RepID=A0ABP2TSN6_9GAMM|nr:hypothetical protein [Acinetobacter proteolyticus]ENU25329.1 hypothetical protein F993_00106 [Acinetobacter proteolyticus]
MMSFNKLGDFELYPVIEVKELYKYKINYFKLVEELNLLKKENEALKLYIVKIVNQDFIAD